MGEEKANVSEYCKRLRLSLWRNHLGLKDTPENNRLIEVFFFGAVLKLINQLISFSRTLSALTHFGEFGKKWLQRIPRFLKKYLQISQTVLISFFEILSLQFFDFFFFNFKSEMKKYEDFCKGFKKDGKIPLTHTVRTKSPYLGSFFFKFFSLSNLNNFSENAEAATFEMDRYIQQVQGHLVHFPLEFLEKSDLSLKKRNVEKLFPSALFI